MREKINLLLALLLIGGFALSFSSCSDKDVNETEVFDPSDPYGKTTEDAEALLSILYSTADIDSLPNDWNKANYKEEPTIGKVLDEANPYVRSTGAVSADEAISFFNSITSSSVEADATSASWSKEGIGSLNLNVVNKDGVYATIDVNIQQLPHLSQIRFIDKDLLGENADSKPAYYQIGDVVSTVEDGQTIYWVCVRNCNKSFDKGKSHWVSFQLSDKNYKTYEANAKKGLGYLKVPYKLSTSQAVTEDIENAVKLFSAVSDPSAYDTEKAFEKGLGEFGKVTYPVSMVRKIANQWNKKNIIEKLLPQSVINEKGLTWERVYKMPFPVIFYYYGHDKTSKEMTLYGRAISAERSKFISKEANSSWTLDQKSFDITSYVKNGSRLGGGIQTDNPIGRTANNALVIRCKTGKELCGKGSTWGNDPDYTKPFPDDAPTKVTEVYHYDPNEADEYQVGDWARSSDGSFWTCIASPCQGNTKTIFITTDNIKYSADKKVILNSDLLTVQDAYYVFAIFNMMGVYKSDKYVQTFIENMEDQAFGAIPYNSYRQRRKYLGTDGTGNYGLFTTFAVKPNSTTSIHQPLLRMFQDNSRNVDTGILKGFLNYQGSNTKMYLEDANDLTKAQSYTRNDSLVQKFYDKAPLYRSKAGNTTADAYAYYRAGSVFNGTQITEGRFGDPNDYFSIFMEPVAVLRIKVLEPGADSDLVPLAVNLSGNGDALVSWFQTAIQSFNNSQAYGNFVFLDGAPYKVPFAGQ